jgi:hypothetical protein
VNWRQVELGRFFSDHLCATQVECAEALGISTHGRQSSRADDPRRMAEVSATTTWIKSPGPEGVEAFVGVGGQARCGP